MAPLGADVPQGTAPHRAAAHGGLEGGHAAGLGAQNAFTAPGWSWGDRASPTQAKAAVATTRADLVSATTASNVTVDVGASVTGMVDVAYDHDWYKLTLVAGRSYDMALRGRDSGGGTLADPYLALRSSTGALIKSDNDTGAGYD